MKITKFLYLKFKKKIFCRKIVDNSISPKELVKLSPEELASQELARWREKENQHQLEMIKKTELELMTKGNTYIMKSHKGEQVSVSITNCINMLNDVTQRRN